MVTASTTSEEDAAIMQKRVADTAAAYTGGPLVDKHLADDIRRCVLIALCEDLGLDWLSVLQFASLPAEVLELDLTSRSTIPANAKAKAVMLAKAPGMVAGLPAIEQTFKLLDPQCTVKFACPEGAAITRTPARIAHIEGNARAMLIAERTALNIIQRLSGIATLAQRFSCKAIPLGIAIVDTRKTTPGMRTLEKYAVKIGGAANHRYGLFDAILIKDNHIRVAGGITAAIKQARAANPQMPVEVETATLDEVAEALEQQAEKIMLDNMSPDLIRQAVAKINGASLIEVSGGVNADNLDSYLIKGVNAISMGALTHSVRSLDISLDVEV
jgi:nicotinate-nucleotide pyrophosphorylase (carboxylating)